MDTAENTAMNSPQKPRQFRCRNLDKSRVRIADKKSLLDGMGLNRRKTVIASLTRPRGIHVSELSELTGLRLRHCYGVVQELMVFGKLKILPSTEKSAGKRLRIEQFDLQQYLNVVT